MVSEMQTSFNEPINCGCFNVRRAARKLTQVYDRHLKPSGLQATQFTLLAMLADSQVHDGVLMTELAARMGMDRTTLTRNLAVAERPGWIEINQGVDRRQRRIKLAAAGRERLRKAMPLWRNAQDELEQALGAASLNSLLKLTHRLDAL